MKKTLLLLCFVFTLLLAGCDPFVFPKGVWRCDELDINMDFSSLSGTVVTDGVVKEIRCSIDYGGFCDIYYKPANYPIENASFFLGNGGKKYYLGPGEKANESNELVFLYKGQIRYIDRFLGGNNNTGKGMKLIAKKKVGGEWGGEREYVFERVYSEGEPKDRITSVFTEPWLYAAAYFYKFYLFYYGHTEFFIIATGVLFLIIAVKLRPPKKK